jgi:hypothetical protein
MVTSDRIPPRPAAKSGQPSPSRIEEIHVQLIKLHRRWERLDDLDSNLGRSYDNSSEPDSSEAKLRNRKLREDARNKVCLITARIEALTEALSMEVPQTARECLICELHARWPAQRPLEDPSLQKGDGVVEYVETAERIAFNVITGLERIAGVTREELGCTGWYFEGDKEQLAAA